MIQIKKEKSFVYSFHHVRGHLADYTVSIFHRMKCVPYSQNGMELKLSIGFSTTKIKSVKYISVYLELYWIILLTFKRQFLSHIMICQHFWLLYIHIIIIIIINVTSNDSIQPSTVVSDQWLCESLCGHWNYWIQSAVQLKYCRQGRS